MFQTLKTLLHKPIKVDEEGHFKFGVTDRTARKLALREKHARLKQVRLELFNLLGQHPSSRQLMRHLAMVERTLQAEGFSGVEELPVRFVARALKELESVVWDWTPAGLAELRSRMAVIVKNRPLSVPVTVPPAGQEPATPSAALSDFNPNVRADVSEVDHAEYEEMQRSWAGFIPMAPQDPSQAAGAQPIAA